VPNSDYVVLNEETMESWRNLTDKIYSHFNSDAQYEAYMNGLIDWDGNEIEEY
jgi:hypothetical protein